MNIRYFNFVGGANVMVSPFLMADNDLEVADNINVTYRLGAILKRLGYAQVGGALDAKPITGLHNFRQSSSVQKILATCNNSAGTNLTLQWNNSGTWEDIVLSSAWDGYEDATVEMEDFLGHCFFVGYDSTDGAWLPVASLTGTTFSTSANVTSMPQAKYIKRYRDRLYIANCYETSARPYRVYYSSVPTAGAITWTVATDFIDVDYSEAITGLGSNWDRLMIFTEYSAYMYDQSTKKNVWDVGCSNHRTIKNSGAYMMWANRDGVWVSTGGRPENIAGKMMDFIKFGTPSDFFAEVIDEEYHLHVGDVTVDGVDYTNCSIIYNIPSSTWRWAEYSDQPTVFAFYNDSGDDRLYMGTQDGEVMNHSKYTDDTPVYSDDGADIQAYFKTKPFDFGIAEEYKSLRKMYAYANRAQGLQLKSLVLNKNSVGLLKPESLGQLNKYINEFSPSVKNGELLQIEGVEVGVNPYFSLYGFVMDIDQVTNKK